MKFSKVVKTAKESTYNREFVNLILRADDGATKEDKKQFADWFEDQEWSDLNRIGIGCNSTPGDHFEYAEDLTWEELLAWGNLSD